jgi:hypothetical protein
MKKKLIFVAMLVSLLAFGLIFVGCDDGSTSGGDSGGTTGGGDEDALLGTWVKDSTTKMRFQTLGSGSHTEDCIDSIWSAYDYTASNGKVNAGSGKLTFDYVISGNKLTVSNMAGTASQISGDSAATVKAKYEGDYTKQ